MSVWCLKYHCLLVETDFQCIQGLVIKYRSGWAGKGKSNGGGRGGPSFSCLKKRWLKENYIILYLIFNVTALEKQSKATQFFKISRGSMPPPPSPNSPRIVGFVNEGPKQSLAPLPHKNLSTGPREFRQAYVKTEESPPLLL